MQVIKDFSIEQLKLYVEDKNVYLFGAGIQGRRLSMILENWNLVHCIKAYIDNDEQKQNSYIEYKNNKFPIISLKEAYFRCLGNDIIIISSIHYEEILKQVEDIDRSNKLVCIIFAKIAETELQICDYGEVVKTYNSEVIPKTIHYAWFGKKMPDSIKRNIEGWRELCPDYEIIEWNENNYDITKNCYMRQAYEHKIWGFVPDFMRLDIVYEYGGIYLDTDIELIKRPDELLYQDAFGCIDASLVMNLGSGFGAKPKCKIIKLLRDYYDNIKFIDELGHVDKTTCNTHNFIVLQQLGYIVGNKVQNVCGMNIYPMVFQGACQYTRMRRVTDNTFWVHYGNMSWMDCSVSEI